MVKEKTEDGVEEGRGGGERGRRERATRPEGVTPISVVHTNTHTHTHTHTHLPVSYTHLTLPTKRRV